jgi:endonuclease YncB( thermonuclease family)
VRIRYGDAPEIDQPGGRASKAELERLVGGHWVVLDRPGREPWGRVLAGLKVGGRCVSEAMIRSGHMVAYYANAACKRAEAAAKKARRGFWSRPGRVLPKDWRKGKR